MNRDTLWTIARDNAISDRESYLDAWSCTDNTEVISETTSAIKRFRSLKGKTFKEAMAVDVEGVRLALLAAECWYQQRHPVN